ncbi:hypothetical protein BO70DRAFT_146387 [Aspergillus heteromorphus CBS 117.55]|uniref:Uncharacterized protein n=1 Tax=Aspergillus heteromorphus CBS 117.55 TaxID=1448321 RepID=A0A317V8U8_9EURO|nr:uncharacterized protein BO70DRAFT_146387 [Aspergillus heteromorphus CBS 117.55]PWY69789.1 hypothetical protein BO70DRAFT_146387 [Aspergillus heteromorphus CBS 117.55]
MVWTFHTVSTLLASHPSIASHCMSRAPCFFALCFAYIVSSIEQSVFSLWVRHQISRLKALMLSITRCHFLCLLDDFSYHLVSALVQTPLVISYGR